MLMSHDPDIIFMFDDLAPRLLSHHLGPRLASYEHIPGLLSRDMVPRLMSGDLDTRLVSRDLASRPERRQMTICCDQNWALKMAELLHGHLSIVGYDASVSADEQCVFPRNRSHELGVKYVSACFSPNASVY